MSNNFEYYLESKFKKVRFALLFFFVFLTLMFFISNEYYIVALSIVIQSIILYSMYYLYVLFLQYPLKQYTLTTDIEVNQLNILTNFKPPSFNYSLSDNILMFKIFLHKKYLDNNYRYKKKLDEKIRFHINSIWKIVLLEKKMYKQFLAKILVYNFLFAIILLFVIILFYSITDWNNDILAKNIYIFNSFFIISFWLYVNIILLTGEGFVRYVDTIEDKNNILSIYNNSNITKSLKEYKQELERSNTLILAYINISSSILYVSFLALIGIIF